VEDPIDTVEMATYSMGEAIQVIGVRDIQLDYWCRLRESFGDSLHKGHPPEASQDELSALFLRDPCDRERDGLLRDYPRDQ
jgi:hypothetical protein